MDLIFVASLSGGTQAGLVCEKSLAGYQGKRPGMRLDETADYLNPQVAHLVVVIFAQ